MRTRQLCLICTCVVFVARAAAAQAPSTPPPAVAEAPTSVLLPNYSGVPIGEIGGLEVGAFLARADDSSSVFYNPAGLTRADRTSVSGTAGVFQFGAVSADVVDRESSPAFQQVPAMFAVVLKDFLGRNDLAAGLSIARTAAWQQTVDFARTRQIGSATDRTSYSSDARMDVWLASLGVGYAGKGNWRTGFSLDAQLTNIARRQALANQYLMPNALTALSINSRSEASAAHFRFTAGAQYQLTPSLITGAVVRTRGLGIYSSGLEMLEGVSTEHNATSTASFFDGDPEVSYRIPLEFKSGVAYVGSRAQAEFDVFVFGGNGEYNVYTSAQPLTIMVDGGSGPPSVTNFSAVPPVIDSATVVNIALGGHINLTANGSWKVHGGYGTDDSPVGAHDTVFTRVDLHKITAGTSFRARHFLGSIGVQYLAGETEPIPLRALPSGQITTTFKLNSLGLLYSLTVLF